MSAPTQLQSPYRAPVRLNEFRNPHLQQALNPQQHQPMQAPNTHRSYIQQGGSQGRTLNGQQARVMAPSQVSRQGNSLAGLFGQLELLPKANNLGLLLLAWFPNSPNLFHFKIKFL